MHEVGEMIRNGETVYYIIVGDWMYQTPLANDARWLRIVTYTDLARLRNGCEQPPFCKRVTVTELKR